jgi:futalosine hydrolase
VPKLLIVAATYSEISPLIEYFGVVDKPLQTLISLDKEGAVTLLITGVGMVNTAHSLGKNLPADVELIVNAGICGAFKRTLQIGEVVNVTHDCLSEMGAENDDVFIPYQHLGLGGTNEYSSNYQNKFTALNTLNEVKGITVNKVHGNQKSIEAIVDLLNPDTESMEGAAFLMACQQSSSEFIQIRAISNYVEKRDKSKWNIGLAVTNLNSILMVLINELTHSRTH